ncbi:hypothetical protein CHS0354_014637 [Potamilus streckersoni]|uniref:Uncharacterized protein n=1 Tax=Potamilus streckersoni TaxID=2493646 RepID=A0AAE0SQ03_9BIVA|nr:hypothetical protein CHS0354_014637 [Potamilus streckersoni]
MSDNGERSLPRYTDVIMATAIPSQHEIALPYTNIDLESIIYQYNDEPAYANLNIRPPSWQTPPPSDLYDSSTSISHGDVSEPPSPRTPHLAETLPITLLDPLHSSSRQCKFDIGEEWEAFQLRKAASCPSSPNHNIRSESKIFSISSNSELATNNTVQGPSSPRPSMKQNVEVKEQFPLHLFLTNETVAVTPDYQINPNPYNWINQKFHSTLQCPCFLFFFFLCCLPGIYYMQRSDIKYKRGEKETARMLGIRATIFFATGSIVGIIFLTVSMFFAVEYIRQFVQ